MSLLQGLTTRGRSFLAAGAASAGCALFLGYPELMRIGAFLLILPFLSAVFARLADSRLEATRTVSPHHVAAGSVATVDLSVTHTSTWPTGAITLREEIPPALGPAPRFAISPGRRRTLRASYTVRSERRGAYHLGPATAAVFDPLGLASVAHSDHNTVSLVVTPRITALPVVGLSGAWSGTGEHQARSFVTGSAEDVTVREYHHGDDLRRVHWRSSAKTGELMVRREEQPWQARATVFLDNRAHAHSGDGAASSFEWAVEIAASVAVHLGEQRLDVSLVTADGVATVGQAAILERLALVDTVTTTRLECPPDTGLLVAALGRLHATDQPALVRLRSSASLSRAFAPSDADASWLGALGFRATGCPVGGSPAEAWKRLGNPGIRRASPTKAPA